jgi:glycosyltransferase involved in cell wall biosynthesis
MSSPDQIVSAGRAGSAAHQSLAVASRGDALTPYLFQALQRRFGEVGFIDRELTPAQRYRVAALTFRPTRTRWVERFYKSSHANRLRSANAARAMRSLAERPDVVLQVHALFAQSEAPGVLYLDCTHAQSAALWPPWNPLRGRALRVWYRQEREIYCAAQHLFAFSEATRTSLIDDYGIDPGKVTVTGAGVNFDQLPQLSVTERSRTKREPTILLIGNDFVRKGGLVLLEAFRQVRATLPEARLQLVGVDPGIRREPGVEILGRISDRERIATLYADAAVFAVPSFFDPYPLVALEAMAFARPVVATRQMGTPEMIVDGSTGLLVEPGNATELAAALLRVMTDPESAARLGAAARRDVELRFTWDAVVDRMAPVLDRLLAAARE